MKEKLENIKEHILTTGAKLKVQIKGNVLETILFVNNKQRDVCYGKVYFCGRPIVSHRIILMLNQEHF